MIVNQALVINTKLMKNRGMKVRNGDRVLH
jgi:hypothetical protein